MLILMHYSERRGYLQLNGRSMPDTFIAAKCGLDVQTYRTLLSELDDAAVPSRTPEGTIFNRRMVRDEQVRAKERKKKQDQRHGKKDVPDVVPNAVPKLSEDEVVDVVHVEVAAKEKPKPSEKKPEMPIWLEERTWHDFKQMRDRIGKPMTPRAAQLIWNKLEKLMGEGFNPILVLEQSIRNSWQDVYPLKGEYGRTEPQSHRQISKTEQREDRAREVVGNLRAKLFGNHDVGDDGMPPQAHGSAGRADVPDDLAGAVEVLPPRRH